MTTFASARANSRQRVVGRAKAFVVLLAFAFWTGSIAAAVAVGPLRVTGERGDAACEDALQIARASFDSTSIVLYSPLTLPEAMRSRMVLGTDALDISGGDALQSTDAFEKLPVKSRSAYWSRKPEGSRRLVVVESDMGWRGDMYALYLLDAKFEHSAFLELAVSHKLDKVVQPLLADEWRPPLVFERIDDGRQWFIDVGDHWRTMPDWTVYAASQAQPLCTISFTQGSKDPVARLPSAVRRLALQLDGTLGYGPEQGTLQATARRRVLVSQLLAKAALRPWAVGDEAYNTRRTVDEGLDAWAKIDAAHARLRSGIARSYPRAEEALAGYYAHRFHQSAEASRATAARVLDVIYRAGFAFHEEAAPFVQRDESS